MRAEKTTFDVSLRTNQAKAARKSQLEHRFQLFFCARHRWSHSCSSHFRVGAILRVFQVENLGNCARRVIQPALFYIMYHPSGEQLCSKAGGRNKIKSAPCMCVCDGSIYANDLLSSRRLLLLRVSTPYGVSRVYSEHRNDIRLTATRAVCLHTLSRSVARLAGLLRRPVHNWAAAALCVFA